MQAVSMRSEESSSDRIRWGSVLWRVLGSVRNVLGVTGVYELFEPLARRVESRLSSGCKDLTRMEWNHQYCSRILFVPSFVFHQDRVARLEVRMRSPSSARGCSILMKSVVFKKNLQAIEVLEDVPIWLLHSVNATTGVAMNVDRRSVLKQQGITLSLT